MEAIIDAVFKGLVGLLTIWVGRGAVKERIANKKGLSGNPMRCEEMVERIGIVETKVDNIEEDVNYLRGRIDEFKGT